MPLQAEDGMEITVVGFEPDVWAAVQAANSYNDPPLPGNRMVFVRIHMRNVAGGAEARSVMDSDFSLVGSSNEVFTTFGERSRCGVIPDELRAELFEGGETEGNVCFQIPEDEASLILIYEESWISRKYLVAQPG